MRTARGPEMDRAVVSAVRKTIGPSHDLIVDGSMRYSLAEAREFGQFLAENKVFWFEEPFAPEDLASFRRLCGAPSASGWRRGKTSLACRVSVNSSTVDASILFSPMPHAAAA